MVSETVTVGIITIVPATGTATLTDPDEGTPSAAASSRNGAATVSNPGTGTMTPASNADAGTATVTDPREGVSSLTIT